MVIPAAVVACIDRMKSGHHIDLPWPRIKLAAYFLLG
jgi:hypothetical protein